MKVAYFSKTSFVGPGSRYRIYQYIHHLEKEGIYVEVYPLFKEGYFSIIKISNKLIRVFLKAIYTFASFSLRIRDICKIRKSNLVIIEDQLFPYFPPFFEWAIKNLKNNLIIEFDDAIYLTFLHRKKMERLIRWSRHTIVGNEFLKKFATRFNNNVSVIPTVIDTRRYRVKSSYKNQYRKIIIGWIGLSYNLHYLYELEDVIAELGNEFPLILNVVSSGGFYMKRVNVLFKEWDYKTEVDDIQKFDIGIMPLKDDEWSRGKCGFKLLQYMACGVTPVASGVGVNCKIIEDGVNGFIANSSEEWFNKLYILCKDSILREKIGRAGRKTVEEKYSLEVWSKELSKLYISLDPN